MNVKIEPVVENVGAADTVLVWYCSLARPHMGQEVARVSPRRRVTRPFERGSEPFDRKLVSQK